MQKKYRDFVNSGVLLLVLLLFGTIRSEAQGFGGNGFEGTLPTGITLSTSFAGGTASPLTGAGSFANTSPISPRWGGFLEGTQSRLVESPQAQSGARYLWTKDLICAYFYLCNLHTNDEVTISWYGAAASTSAASQIFELGSKPDGTYTGTSDYDVVSYSAGGILWDAGYNPGNNATASFVEWNLPANPGWSDTALDSDGIPWVQYSVTLKYLGSAGFLNIAISSYGNDGVGDNKAAVLDNVQASSPAGNVFSTTAPTCTGSTPNNNGVINLTAIVSGSTRYGVSTINATTYDGPAYAAATVMYTVADGWNQVPFRQPGENLLNPPTVLKGAEAVDFVISELNAIINDLPDGPNTSANKNAAKGLLMRAYLNKGTFADRTNPTFPSADMTQVITYADQIISSGQYSIDDNYFDNFAPNNDQVSSENIFASGNQGGVSSGNIRSRWFCGLHYNQNPSGWNGFATLSDFYDSFEDSDKRKKGSYAGMTDVSGINAGFLIGQQVDQNGVELNDRKGNKLAYTREVKLTETGNDLEITGIRVMKFPIDYAHGDNADNDMPLIRYADVLLMKAEALLRSGDAGAALTIVNDLRAKRGATALGSLDTDNLLAERGRELYWEALRRTDLIRFGKFLSAFQEKPASTSERLLFPIPAAALAVNPNLEQNPGYR